jgi:hypothetical protein
MLPQSHRRSQLNYDRTPEIEYLTIFADSSKHALEQFARRQLSEQGYSIAGPIGRHRLETAEGTTASLAAPEGTVAATFRRVRQD